MFQPETVVPRQWHIPTRPLGVGDPEILGPYRLLGILGAGGMGCVYLGRDDAGHIVAVKVVRPDLADDKTFRARFRREVAAARRVAGPHTVPVFDADVDGPYPWLATGYVSGPSLTDAVEEFGPLPEPSLIALAAGLARALTDVHATGMVHRDLKPSNVLLAAEGPRVIDFGIARASQEETALTTAGMIIGSPGYMSPEQITSGAAGAPGDVFALGGVLVYAATGVGPFGTGDTISMLWRVTQKQPQLDGVPAVLRALVEACLAKDPETRPTPMEIGRHLAALNPPSADRWLPAPILTEIDHRTADLLELQTSVPTRRAAPTPQATAAPVRTAAGSMPSGEQATASSSVPGAASSFPRTSSFPGDRRPHTGGTAVLRRNKRPLIIGGVVAVILVAAAAIGIAVAGSGGTSRQAAVNTPVTTGSAAPGATGSPGAAGPEPTAGGPEPVTPAALPDEFIGD